MKKNLLSAVLATLICVTMIFTLGACDKAPVGEVSGTSMEGKWVLSGMSINGEDALADIKAMLGDAFDMESIMFCEFSNDGTFVMSAYDETETGTYVVNGNALVMTVDGDDQAATIDGDTFTIVSPDENEVTTITFKKK